MSNRLPSETPSSRKPLGSIAPGRQTQERYKHFGNSIIRRFTGFIIFCRTRHMITSWRLLVAPVFETKK